MSDMLYGVEAWVEYLKDRSLPVRNSVLRRLQRQLKDDSIALHKINYTIKSDPVLCLHVVRKASDMHLQKDSKVTGIDHAISSLGLNNIEAVVKEATPLKLNPSSVAQKMYFRSIAVSHHAATQATHWLQQTRKNTFVDETYLATLFYGVAHWMLWHHAALHMSEIEVKIREEGVEPVLAENDTLGNSIQEISKGLIEAWGISELAVTSLEHETSPNKKTLAQLHQRALGDPRITDADLREINHLVQEKFFPVKLANWLADASNLGWQKPKAMKVVDIINDFLKGEIAETLGMLHATCARSSQQYHVAGTLAPAAEMLMLPSDLHINYCLSKKETAILSKSLPAIEKPVIEKPKPPKKVDVKVSAPKIPPKNEYLDQNIYNQIAERFLKGYHLYTEPKHILQGLLQGINKGVGFERAALYIINAKKQQIKTGFFVGFEDNHPVARFQYNLEVPSLFKKLSEKPGCICVKPENMEQMLHMLPETYSDWANKKGFVLTSVFFGNSPIAIIHADYGSSGPEISDFHHDRLKYLSSAAGLGLKKLKKG